MKVLIALASGIGNSILFSPTLTALRKNYPKAKIDIFAYKAAFAEPFKGSELINEIIYYKGLYTFLKLRKEKYNISITAFPSNKWQFNVFAFLVGAKKRLTHSYKVSKVLTLHSLQNLKIPADENLHDVDQNLNLLKLLNIEIPKKKELIFHTSKEDEKFAKDFLKKYNLSKKYLIGVHPGSGPIDYKRVPTKKFAELINKNSKQNSVILIFGAKDEEKIKQELKNSLKQKAYIIETNLKDTASLIKECDLFITNDTGLMHIASTSGKTKIIALFNGTNPIRTRPYTKNSEVIILKENKLKYPFWSTIARER